MDTRRLTGFLHVAEYESFSQAARKLGLSQATISQQVASLESEVGVPLFRRTGRGAKLTEAGHLLLPRATRIVHEARAALRDIGERERTPTGRIRLGVPPSVSHSLIASFVLQLRRRFPDVMLSITEGSSGFVQDWLTRGQLDIGITYKLEKTALPSQDVLLSEGLSLVCRRDDPLLRQDGICFDALADLPLILPSRPHGLRSLLEKIAQQRGRTLLPVLELDGAAMVPTLVASGCGYSVLPDVTVRLDMAHKGLASTPIRDPVLRRTMMIEATVESRARPSVQVAIDVLRAQVTTVGQVGALEKACGLPDHAGTDLPGRTLQ